MANKKAKEVTLVEGYDIDQWLDNKPFIVFYSCLKLKVKLLTREDALVADEAARQRTGGSKDDPYGDYLAEETFKRCVVGWEHRKGGPVRYGGKELKFSAKNTYLLATKITGLAVFIFKNAQSADNMYSTLEETEIKN